MIEIETVSNSHDALIANEIFELLKSVYGDAAASLESIAFDLATPARKIWLARADGKLVGYLLAQTVTDEREIWQVAVSPDYRRKGIASQLLSAACDFDGTIFLDVHESNTAAIALYKKFDFVSYNERPDYYKNPREAALLMKREK